MIIFKNISMNKYPNALFGIFHAQRGDKCGDNPTHFGGKVGSYRGIPVEEISLTHSPSLTYPLLESFTHTLTELIKVCDVRKYDLSTVSTAPTTTTTFISLKKDFT